MMLYSLLSHALACRKGTARIQLRCRAVSATVLIWMLVFRCSFFVFSVLGSKYVSKMVPQILKNAPQMGPKAPKFGPKSVKMDQKWVQNGQDGTQIAHPEAQLDFRGFSGRKTRPKWRPKWSKNRSKNHSKLPLRAVPNLRRNVQKKLVS